MTHTLPLPIRWATVAASAAALALVVGRSATRASAAVNAPSAARTLPITGAAAIPHHTPAPPSAASAGLGDSLLGVSGKLRVHLMSATDLATLNGVGGAISSEPGGVYQVPGGIGGQPFALLPMRNFSAKLGAYVGDYRVGYWPAELHRVRSRSYQNPEGFVQVTPGNADTRISEHFLLRDFLTHDQPDVWPKYLVLREALLDKLELVLADLSLSGVPASRAIVLSGFRTPAYNLALGDASGRARESRHQFGDAADIIIDSDSDGRMDDLDRNGRSDAGDVRVVERAVERVEHAHPELVGGLGLYQAMGPSGPFAHIDVRGKAARWSGARGRGSQRGTSAQARPVSGCYATGPSAVLCSRIRRRAR
jgi:hypothetical protein